MWRSLYYVVVNQDQRRKERELYAYNTDMNAEILIYPSIPQMYETISKTSICKKYEGATFTKIQKWLNF